MRPGAAEEKKAQQGREEGTENRERGKEIYRRKEIGSDKGEKMAIARATTAAEKGSKKEWVTRANETSSQAVSIAPLVWYKRQCTRFQPMLSIPTPQAPSMTVMEKKKVARTTAAGGGGGGHGNTVSSEAV